MNLTITDLQLQIQRGPALVLGPGLTTSLARESALLKILETSFPIPKCDTPHHSFLDYADTLVALGVTTEEKVRELLRTHLKGEATKNPNLGPVMRAQWTAVVGLCFDNHGIDALRQNIYETPTKWTVTTVTTADDNLPQVTIPYFQLLGDLDDKRESHRAVLSQSQLLRRAREWSAMLSQLPDILKGDPLLFLGTESIPDRICMFMNELLRLGPKAPRRLIFLADDPTHSNPVFRNLISGVCEVQTVAASTREVADSLSKQSISISKLPLFAQRSGKQMDLNALAAIEDQVAYVPRKEEMQVNTNLRNQLLDALFRPTHLDWNPYYLEMQFRRSICDDIGSAVRSVFSPGVSDRIVRIVGEAGIGKTVAMRTVAFEMAQEDYLCLWVKKAYGEVSGGWFDAVTSCVARSVKKKDQKVAFFVDDPSGNRIRLNDIINSLNDCSINWSLVVCTRKSEGHLTTSLSWQNGSTELTAIEIPEFFSPSESEKLPAYLVSLNLAQDLDAATKMVIAPGSHHSRDILCSLWYMLPQTQGAIEDSLIAEYHSLGKVEDSITALANATHKNKGVARMAYELVTTASGFENTPLPVEVLVSALKISYSEWIDSCNEGKPLWGLLYDEHYESAETYAYRTRNYIVTDVLLRLLNGGTSSHTGEFRCLKTLISACRSGAAPYRVFLKDILVHRRKLIENRFTLEQALELYELAEWAYPKPYPLIEHHKCLVKIHRGGDLKETYEDLRRLITRSHDKSLLDQDSSANLNTSAAATLNKLVKKGGINATIASENAFEHISDALRDDQYSMHAHHVHADILISLADSVRDDDQKAFMLILARAAAIVDRALLLVPRDGPKTAEQQKSVELLSKAREQVSVACEDIEKATSAAMTYYEETGDQSGFVYVARILLGRAKDADKGKSYKKVDSYLSQVFDLVENASGTPTNDLRLCRVELTIHWNILPSHGPVYWERFVEDIEHLQHIPRFADDSLLTFFAAVGDFHLKRFPEAEARFQRLRVERQRNETRRDIRCYYIGDKSDPQILEGRIQSSSGEKRFIYLNELGTDVLVNRGNLSGRPDEPQHCRIGFSMLGPIAINR